MVRLRYLYLKPCVFQLGTSCMISTLEDACSSCVSWVALAFLLYMGCLLPFKKRKREGVYIFQKIIKLRKKECGKKLRRENVLVYWGNGYSNSLHNLCVFCDKNKWIIYCFNWLISCRDAYANSYMLIGLLSQQTLQINGLFFKIYITISSLWVWLIKSADQASFIHVTHLVW